MIAFLLGACWRSSVDTNPGRATCESIADHLVKLRHDDELRRAIKTIQQRIDEKGLDQQVATDDEIIVELSRTDDVERVRDLARDRLELKDRIELKVPHTNEPLARDTLIARCAADEWSLAVRKCFATAKAWSECAPMLDSYRGASMRRSSIHK